MIIKKLFNPAFGLMNRLKRLGVGRLSGIAGPNQAEETLRRYAERLKVLHEIDQGILAAHSPEAIAQAALPHIRQLIPCRWASMTLFDLESHEAVILAVQVNGDTHLESGKHFPLETFGATADLQQDQSRLVENILDLAELSPFDQYLLAEGIRSFITIPLIARGELIGCLTLGATRPGLFNLESVEIAGEVAAQLAIAILQVRVFEAEAQRRQEAEALRDTAAALNSTLDLEDVLDRILANVGRVVPHDAADIMLIEAGITHVVRHRGYTGRKSAEAMIGLRFKVADTPNLRQVAESGQPVAILDTQLYPDWIDIPETHWIRSCASAPIRIRGEIIGFLNLNSGTPAFFTSVHAERLQAFADQAAVALQNAQLHTETQRQARELAALNKASRVMTSTLELNTVLEQAMAEAKTLLEAEGASVLLHDPVSNELVFAAVADPDPKALIGKRLPLTAGIAGWVMRERQPILVDNTRLDPRFYDRVDAITGLTTHSLLAVPLIFEETIMGVVEVINKIRGTFDRHDLELLEGLTNSAALAIVRAKLFEAERHQREIAETLGEVTRVVNSSLELAAVLDRMLLELKKVILYDSAMVLLLEQENVQVVAAHGLVDKGAMIGLSLPLTDSPISLQAIRQRQPLIISDTSQDPLFSPVSPCSTPVQSLIVIPLISREEVIGLLSVDSGAPHRYSAQDADVAFRFAQQVVVAIKNARLFEQVQHYTTELEQRVADRTRELSALYEVTAVASESLDLKTMLERLLERVLAAMKGNVGIIRLLDETGEILHLAAQQAIPPQLTPQLEPVPPDSGLASWVIDYGEPLLIPDIAADPRMPQIIRSASFHTYIGAPIRARGQVLGVLSVFGEIAQQFNREEVALLASIADQVGVAVERARLRQLAEQAAVLEERGRLARDLHDSVTQLLYSLALFAKVGREAYRMGDLNQVDHCLAELGNIAQQALKEMRLLIYELRPPLLEREGLIGALQHRLDTVEGRAGVQTQFLVDKMAERPDRLIEEGLYWTALEALNNTLKHAAATSVIVQIHVDDEQVELEVADNGSGFDLNAIGSGGGLGLVSMQERVEKLGGVLTILSAPGEGTRVKVSVRMAGRI